MRFRGFVLIALLVPALSQCRTTQKSGVQEEDERKIRTSVADAIEKNNIALFEKILDKNPTAAKANDYYVGPISYAARDGRVQMVKLLVEKYKVNPDDHYAGDMSPLIYACANNTPENLEIIKYLHSKGANLNFIRDGKSVRVAPLIHAMAHPSLQMTTLLLDLGADVNTINPKIYVQNVKEDFRGTALDYLNAESASRLAAQQKDAAKILNDQIKPLLLKKGAKTLKELEAGNKK